MNPQVNQIDVYTIEDRLRKDKTKEGKEVWNYVKKLKEALARQQELTGLAISKLRKQAKEDYDYAINTKKIKNITL